MVQLEIQFPSKFQKFQEKMLLVRTAVISNELFSTSTTVGELFQSICSMFLV